MAERFPETIDYDSLSKGQLIKPEYLEQLFGVPRTTKTYSFKIMALVGAIKDARPDLYPRQDHDAILIQTDSQAAEYSLRRAKDSLRSLVRQSRDDARIDISVLEEKERRSFESARAVKAMMALSAHGDLKKLRLAEKLRLGK